MRTANTMSVGLWGSKDLSLRLAVVEEDPRRSLGRWRGRLERRVRGRVDEMGSSCGAGMRAGTIRCGAFQSALGPLPTETHALMRTAMCHETDS